MEKQIEEHVRKNYQEVNNRWMDFHLRLLSICNVLICIIEIMMFFIILFFHELNCSIIEYCLKYIGAPVICTSLLTLGTYFILNKKNINNQCKQFVISFAFVLFTFILTIIHSGFVSVLVALSIPVILTIMYEKPLLTLIIAISGTILQFVSGLVIFWDPDKIIDSAYFINLIIIILTTFFVWFICNMMIRFFKLKRDVIIKNDIERHYLQQRINIDELTKVGNKHALEQYLKEIQFDQNNIYYLAMFDLDFFKKLNDSYGHVFGDDVLRYIGDSLLTYCNKGRSFRYGGDEFCIVFENLSISKITAILKRVQNDVSQNIELPDKDFILTISVGIARYRQGYTPIKLLECADKALYTSKNKKGHAITIYEEMKR